MSRTNAAGQDSNDRKKRVGAPDRSIRARLSAALTRSLRRSARKIEPNPRPISREVDF